MIFLKNYEGSGGGGAPQKKFGKIWSKSLFKTLFLEGGILRTFSKTPFLEGGVFLMGGIDSDTR